MSNNIFTKIKIPGIKSSTFDLSHDHKLTLDMGLITPVLCMDICPGDSVRINLQSMLRMAPLISPVMHKIQVKIEAFFCPNRQLWPDWEKFITGELVVAPPGMNSNSFNLKGTIADYLGFPIGGTNNNGELWNALPIAAYVKIYDEYYRDENLQPELIQDLISGNNNWAANFAHDTPFIRAWGHDYFTSCLPWAQKGDSVSLPLATNATVVARTDYPVPDALLRQSLDGTLSEGNVEGDGAPNLGVMRTGNGDSFLDPNGTLEVDLTAEQSTINTLRDQFTLQRFLELNARGGTRITEWIRSQFGEKTDDLRHNRPQFLGSTISNMVISEVLATAETEGTANIEVGNMAGHGISVSGGSNFSYKAKEHGWIIANISVMPKTAYSQGLPKMFNRPTYLDYLIPAFGNLGEQEVLNSEVYVGNELPGTDPELLSGVFGYIPKYSEYKYKDSQVSGDFKYGESLDFWNLGRGFDNQPSLNEEFIQCVPGKRIFAVIDAGVHSIYAHVFCNIKITRKLPKYGIPHF